MNVQPRRRRDRTLAPMHVRNDQHYQSLHGGLGACGLSRAMPGTWSSLRIGGWKGGSVPLNGTVSWKAGGGNRVIGEWTYVHAS